MLIQPKTLGIVYAIIAPFLFGLLPLCWRFVSLPTLNLIGYRCLYTFAVFGLILMMTRQWKTVRTFSPDVIAKVAKSAFYLALHLGFFMGAIALGYQVEAAIGMFLAPAATAILATFLLGEKLTPIKQTCVALSVFAAILFFYQAQELPRFAVFIALTWGAYLCDRKHALAKINNSIAYSWLEQSLIAGVLMLILANFSPATSQLNGANLMSLGVGCSLATIAGFLQAKASQLIDCSQVGMLGVLSPVVQFSLAVVVDQKPVSLLQAIAIALLLIAVLLYNCPPLKSKVN